MAKSYIKRMMKYVLHEHKQPIIHSDVVVKEKNSIHKNKKYIITGGGSGLGFYIAKSLIEGGATVIICGRNEKKLKDAKKKLGERCDYAVMDVADVEDACATLDDIFEKHKSIDGLVNNAGISLHEKDILDVTVDNFDAQFNTNLKGAYFLSKKYIECFKQNKQKNGNIVFISSERGSMCDDIPYGLTKAAINSLTGGLSRRFYKNGIRVNAIAPGVTCSALTKIDRNSDLYAEKAAGRVLLPEEIAETVNFILSDYSKCISGEVINCDAGNSLACWF